MRSSTESGGVGPRPKCSRLPCCVSMDEATAKRRTCRRPACTSSTRVPARWADCPRSTRNQPSASLSLIRSTSTPSGDAINASMSPSLSTSATATPVVPRSGRSDRCSAVVTKQLQGHGDVGDEQVLVAIVVEVRPGAAGELLSSPIPDDTATSRYAESPRTNR